MKVKSIYIGLIIIFFVFGGIFVTSISGYWNTENTKTPAKYTDGEFQGQYNPDDIRGSYTFGEISELFDIPLEDLGKAFNVVPSDRYQEFSCKELETIYIESANEGKEVGTGSVRIFVALYKSLPIALDESTYFPETALDILKSNVNLSEDKIDYLKSHMVKPLDSTKSVEPTTTEKSTEESTGITIKGSTTFKEILESGIDIADLEKVINGKIDDESITIKSYCDSNGTEFSVVKIEIQKLTDSKE